MEPECSDDPNQECRKIGDVDAENSTDQECEIGLGSAVDRGQGEDEATEHEKQHDSLSAKGSHEIQKKPANRGGGLGVLLPQKSKMVQNDDHRGQATARVQFEIASLSYRSAKSAQYRSLVGSLVCRVRRAFCYKPEFPLGLGFRAYAR